MRNLFCVVLILVSTNAFAGGRHIYCDGKIVDMDVSAKGPTPSDEINMSIRDPLVMNQIAGIDDDSASYAFTRVYQAKDATIGLTAILRYADGKHTFSVFHAGNLIEEVPCTLGF